MIQRIQSIYLFIALAIFIYFSAGASIASFQGNDIIYTLYSTNLISSTAHVGNADVSSQYYFIGSVVLAVWMIVVMFSFRNLSRQLSFARMGTFGMIVFLAIILSSVLIGSSITEDPAITYGNSSFGTGSYLLIVAFISYLLAIRNIKKDKKLIDSVDRIR